MKKEWVVPNSDNGLRYGQVETNRMMRFHNRRKHGSRNWPDVTYQAGSDRDVAKLKYCRHPPHRLQQQFDRHITDSPCPNNDQTLPQ